MKSGGGKQKGAEQERVVCKNLSLWVSNNKRDDLYWRSAMSGGRASLQFKKGKENLTQVGDISCIDSEGEKLTNKYVIEVKSYKNLHLESLIYGTPKNSSILEFWYILCNQCKKVNKKPMLIAKQNFKSTIVLLQRELKYDIFVKKYINFYFSELYTDISLMYFDDLLKINFNVFIKE